jgi:hypothetical protein
LRCVAVSCFLSKVSKAGKQKQASKAGKQSRQAKQASKAGKRSRQAKAGKQALTVHFTINHTGVHNKTAAH